MKKTYRFILTLTILGTISNLAFADGNAFTPLNFDDAAYSAPKTSPTVQATSSNPVSNTLLKVFPAKNTVAENTATGEVPIGNDNIQNAILELDNAQVGIRNDLLEYKSKYSDTDAQYKLVKNERSMLQKQIRSIERRIKNIDKAKEKIRKNML